MTRIAVLCDIHGNLPALEAVVSELDVDLVVAGGDIASRVVSARDALAAALAGGFRCASCAGNADRVLDLDGIPEPNRSARLWVAERLGEENLRFLAGLPLDLVIDSFHFCHGAPGSDTSRSRA